MRTHYVIAALCCLLAVSGAGCNDAPVRADFDFNKDGWGGPFLEYTFNPQTDTYRITSGALVSRDFRWANSQVSFQFLDKSKMVWGLVLLDHAFGKARREWMHEGWIKIAPGNFKPGKNLRYQKLWLYDRVAELTFRHGGEGRAYKVLDAWWDNQFIDGQRSIRLRAEQALRVKRNTWNTLSVQIERGVLTYALNGQPCRKEERLKIDPRANGRLGMFVYKDGGPLLIRNLKLAAPGRPAMPSQGSRVGAPGRSVNAPANSRGDG